MFVDVHTHLGRIFYGRRRLTAGGLLRWMDRHDVERACVMAVENPEETHFYATTEDILRWTKRHRDRLLPFCSIDPRRGCRDAADFKPILEDYVARGAVGFGEMLAVLPINDPRLKRIYGMCAALKLPVMLHVGSFGGVDLRGLPYLEEICREFPRTRFIGHAQFFWSEISGKVSPRTRGGYPKTPVAPGGRLGALLSKYPNLYADLSAGSGANALSRDLPHARDWLIAHRRKVCFGSDYLAPGQRVPQFDVLGSLDLPKPVFEAVARGNARRLLRLR